MGAQVVRQHDHNTATRLRARHRPAYLGAESASAAACAQLAIEPARDPIDDAKPLDFGVLAWCDHQPLPTPPFAAPDPGQRWVEGELDFILEIDSGPRQHAQPFGQVCRKETEQIGLDEIGAGWRRGRAGTRQEHLHPQPFPTSPACSSALRVRVQVGRLPTEPWACRCTRTVSAETLRPVVSAT